MQRPRETLFLGLFFIPAPRYILRLDKYVIHFFSMNPIPVKDRIRCATCHPFLVYFLSVRVGAYRIRPTNASAWRRMTDKPDTFWGVCLCALPIPIKNLIPIYGVNLKPGGFWDVCLCDQPHPGEKLLKFVWMHAKPGEDWMKMAISTENPARIGRKWPYPSKTRRGLDENGHIHRKPGEDWTKMAISIENPAGIGFNMNTAIESLPRIGFHTFPGITFWARMGFV